jgi:hypothetical protein
MITTEHRLNIRESARSGDARALEARMPEHASTSRRRILL